MTTTLDTRDTVDVRRIASQARGAFTEALDGETSEIPGWLKGLTPAELQRVGLAASLLLHTVEQLTGGTSVSDYDYGPLQTYELVWRSGHVEQIQAHAIHLPQSSLDLGSFGVHGMIDGRWTLVLVADEADIKSIRLVTTGEPIPGEVAS